jgi:hypothetical protein
VSSPTGSRELAEQEQRLLNTIDSIQFSGSGQSEPARGIEKSKRELDELIARYGEKSEHAYPLSGAGHGREYPLRANEVLLVYKVNPGKPISDHRKRQETVGHRNRLEPGRTYPESRGISERA